MPISFDPMREYMRKHKISYYYLSNEGIESATLQRLRHDEPVTTGTIEKLCRIMNCQPGDLMCYREEPEE